jgi:hypothetical protein
MYKIPIKVVLGKIYVYQGHQAKWQGHQPQFCFFLKNKQVDKNTVEGSVDMYTAVSVVCAEVVVHAAEAEVVLFPHHKIYMKMHFHLKVPHIESMTFVVSLT